MKNEDTILYINTAEAKQVIVGLGKNGEFKSTTLRNQPGSQTLIPAIIKILKQNKVDLKEIGRIEINTGPGSFTGLRVGISVANALGYALKLRINGKPIGKLARIKYQQARL